MVCLYLQMQCGIQACLHIAHLATVWLARRPTACERLWRHCITDVTRFNTILFVKLDHGNSKPLDDSMGI